MITRHKDCFFFLFNEIKELKLHHLIVITKHISKSDQHCHQESYAAGDAYV